jgi:hypothetical protein
MKLLFTVLTIKVKGHVKSLIYIVDKFNLEASKTRNKITVLCDVIPLSLVEIHKG